MRVTRFRVKDYKCIEDSGWNGMGNVTAIVGKNESGKTAILEALRKFNSDGNEFTPKDFPRNRAQAYDRDTICVEIEFQLEDNEKAELEAMAPELTGIDSIEVSKSYDNLFYLNLEDIFPETTIGNIIHILEESLEVNLPEELTSLQAEQEKSLSDFISHLLEEHESDDGGVLQAQWEEYKKQATALPEAVQPENLPVVSRMLEDSDEIVKNIVTRLRKYDVVTDKIIEMLPSFVYFEQYDIIEGKINLNEFIEAKKAGSLKRDFRTMDNLFSMADLDVNELARLNEIRDMESRQILCHGASTSITGLTTGFWKQKNYEVEFKVDGETLMTLVVGRTKSDEKIPIALEDQSKGFRWHFSFNVNFNAATRSELKGAVLLLDEPGLHLHPAAQGDLLKLIDKLAKNNQIIYTTHSPFMVDGNKLSDVKICRDSLPSDGEKQLSAKYWTGDKDSVYPLLSAIGFDLSQSLFVGKQNLILEGITDFWYLTTLSSYLDGTSKEGLKSAIIPTPVGGASRILQMATFMRGQNLDVLVLLDSDTEGEWAKKELLKNPILKKKQVLMISDLFDDGKERDIEDLIPEEFFLTLVMKSYEAELKARKIETIELPENRPPRIVKSLEEYFKNQKLQTFVKTRPANFLLREWGTLQGSAPDSLFVNFENLIKKINTYF